MTKTKYPECEKLHAVHEESQKIGEFLTWLKSKVELATWEENEDDDTNAYMPELLYPAHKYGGDYGTQLLLAEYFGIDLDKVEEERRQILEELRKAGKSGGVE